MFKLSKQSYFRGIIAIYLIWPLYFYIGSVNGANILLLLFGISWIVINKMKIKRIRLKSYFAFIVVFWVISRLLVYCYHGEISRAFVFVLYSIVLGIISVDNILDDVSFFALLDVLVKVGFVISCLGIMEAATGINIFAFLNNSNTELNYNAARLGAIRIISFTGQTINYCLFCGMLAILIFYLLNTNAVNKKKRRFYIITYVLLIVNMLLTLSRSSILVFMIAQLLMLNKLGFKKLVKYVLLICFILICGVLIFNVVYSGTNPLLQIVYMLLAVFDESFSSKIVGWSSSQDASGVADRFLLYNWVWKSIKNNLIFGLGEKAGFSYDVRQSDGLYSWIFEKTSIEVNHLSLLYHYGIISTIAEIVVYISCCIKAFLQSKINHTPRENQLNFNYVFFVIVFMDLISWFAVNMGSEKKLLYILFFTWFGYNQKVVMGEVEAE